MKVRAWCLFIVAALSLVSYAKAGTSLLVNGGFEQPISDPTAYITTPTLDGWTVFGPGHSTTGTIDVVGVGPWAPAGGAQSLDLVGDTNQGTGIEQVFSTVAGQKYSLSFDYANNPRGLTNTARVEVLGLASADLLDRTITHSGSQAPPGSMNYVPFSSSFIADSTSATLRFTSLTTLGDIPDRTGVVLDNVSVQGASGGTAVPLPGAFWAGLLTFGGAAAGRKFLCLRRAAVSL